MPPDTEPRVRDETARFLVASRPPRLSLENKLEMTPDEIIAAFERATGLIVDLMKAQRGEPQKPLVVEAKIRLEQSTILLRDFRRAELNYAALKSGLSGWHEAATRLRLYGEAFYYFAWRAREALETCGVRFNPKGVNTVRNRMIEHPDGHNGIPILCWVDLPGVFGPIVTGEWPLRGSLVRSVLPPA